jgi:hypothetical protein
MPLLLLLLLLLLMIHFNEGEHSLHQMHRDKLTTSEFFIWWPTKQHRKEHSGDTVGTLFLSVY